MTPPTTTTTTTSESNSNNTTTNTLNNHPLPHVASISGVQEFAAAAQQQQHQDDRTRTTVPSTSASNSTPTTTTTTTLSQPKACSNTSDNTNTTLTLLSSAQSGARVLFATDEWFASAENLLQDTEPVFDPDAFGPQGKVMDGWETRRRREAGHDWCIVRLGQRGNVQAITIDTAYFTGNHVPQIHLQIADLTNAAQEAAWVAQLPGAVERLLYYNNNHNSQHSPQGTGATPDQVTQAEQATSGSTIVWWDLLPRTPLQPGYADTRYHHFTVPTPLTGTHVRVNYYPDGGVARLRLYGTPVVPGVAPAPRPLYSPIVTGRTCSVLRHPDDEEEEEAVTLEEENEQDNKKRSSSTSVVLFSQRPTFPELSRGGRGVACSNQHYGVPDNLLRTALGRDMGDGWETARHVHRPAVWRKDPVSQLLDSDLSDWCVLELGQVAASVQAIVLDTKHFRGNYPESVLVEGAYRCPENDNNTDDRIEDWEWFPLVPRGRMAPDAEHLYEAHQSYVDNHHQVTTQIVNSERPVSHVRVTLFPDGGLSRVRVYGIPMTS